VDTPNRPENPERKSVVVQATAKQLSALKAAAEHLEEAHRAAAQAAGAVAARWRPQAEAALVPQRSRELKTDPKLRHEFVGMMFALAIGEVAVQTATLVRAQQFTDLPLKNFLMLVTSTASPFENSAGISREVSENVTQFTPNCLA